MMLIVLLMQMVTGQTPECPNVFYLHNINSAPQMIAYAEEYNYIAVSQKNVVQIVQVESGTMKDLLSTNIDIVTAMTVNGQWLAVGGANVVTLWGLNQFNNQIDQLSIYGTNTYLQIIDSKVSIGTNNYQNIFWDPINDIFVGIQQSSLVKITQILQQLPAANQYDTILIGQSVSGDTYIEYYAQNMQNLLFQSAFPTSPQILIMTSYQNQITTNIVFVRLTSSVLQYQIVNNQGTVTMTQLSPIVPGYDITMISLDPPINPQWLGIVGVGCQIQQYFPTTATLTPVFIWYTPCQPFQQMIFDYDRLLVILLLTNIQPYNQALQVFNFDGVNTVSLIRSFYYIPEQIQTSAILPNMYVIQAGATTGNLYIVNQWFQQQAIIAPPIASIPIIIQQADLLIVIYANGLMAILSQQEQLTCQFNGYDCYNYAIAATYQQTIIPITSTTVMNVNTCISNDVTYILLSINNVILVYSYISTTFTYITQITLVGNVLQLSINGDYLYALTNDDQIQQMTISTITNPTIITQTYAIAATQIAYTSEYILGINGNTITIYSPQLVQITTLQKYGTNFRQIITYLNQVIIVEDNSFFINFCNIADLLNADYTPYQSVQLMYFFFQYTIDLSNGQLLVVSSEYNFLISLSDYFQGITYTTCQFSQIYGGSSDEVQVTVQNSFRSISVLYSALPKLQTIQAEINIQAKVSLNQIVIDQKVNQNVILVITNVQVTPPDTAPTPVLIQTAVLQGFQSVQISNINIYTTSCTLQIMDVTKVELTNIIIYQTPTTLIGTPPPLVECPYYSITSVSSLIISTISVTNQIMTSTMFQLKEVNAIYLNGIVLSGNTMQKVLTQLEPIILTMNNVQLLNNVFSSADSIFQFYSLDITSSTISGNTIPGIIFTNIVTNSAQITININTLTVRNNNIITYMGSYLLSSICATTQINRQIVTITQLTISTNTVIPTVDSFNALYFYIGDTISITNSNFINSGISVQLFNTITITTVSYTDMNTIGIYIQDIVNVNLLSITYMTASLTNGALLQISTTIMDLNPIISLSNIKMSDATLVSDSLIYNTYGIYMTFKGTTTITMQNINIQQFTLTSQEQSFAVSCTAIYVAGYQVLLRIQDSTFTNSVYTISTSLMNLVVRELIISNSQFTNIKTSSTRFFETMSENGGVAQIYCQYLTIQNSQFDQIMARNGAIFYVQTFSLDSQNVKTNLIFEQLTISNIFSYGSGAIYLDNVHQDTDVTFTSVTFTNIYSLADGGIVYVAGEKDLNVPDIPLSSLTPQNISTLQPNTMSRLILFQSCTFQNLFSTKGTIIQVASYLLQFMSCNFISNELPDISQLPVQPFPIQLLNQGNMIDVSRCVLYINNSIISNLTSGYTLNKRGSVISATLTYISMNNFTIQNSVFKQAPIMSASFSYVTGMQVYLSNCSIIDSSSLVSSIEFINSSVYFNQLNIFSTNCVLKKCMSGGIYLKESLAKIISSTFTSSFGQLGGAISVFSDKSWTIITTSIFNRNVANLYGGAIYGNLLNTSLLNVSTSTFTLNNALSGGAIFTESPVSEYNISEQAQNPVITYANCQFNNNSAIKYGGAIKMLTFNVQQSGCTFAFNNAGIEGNDMSSYPSYLYLAQPLTNQPQSLYVYDKQLELVQGYQFNPVNAGFGQYILSNFKSGDMLLQPLVFLLKSSKNQSMYSDGSALYFNATAKANQILQGSTGNSVVYYQNQKFQLDQVYIFGIPNSTYTFSFNTNAVRGIVHPYYFTSNYIYSFEVDFRPCWYGENIQRYLDQVTCYQCPFKFYSIRIPTDTDFGQCTECPINTQLSCQGGALMNVDKGYWRESVIDLTLYPCDNRYSDCIGGSSSLLCGVGYVGPLCQECDYANDYARDTYDRCVLCATTSWPLAQIIATSLGTIFYLWLSMYFVAKDVVLLCLIPCLNQFLPPAKRIGANFAEVKDLNSLMKIFLAYFQITSIVRYVTTNVPIWVEDVSDPNILSFSLECPLLNFSNRYGIPMVYITYMIEISVPILCMLTFFAIQYIIFRKNRVYRKIYVSSTWLVLWLFFLPNFYKKTLYLLNCTPIGDKSYVQADLTQECYGTEHFFYTLFIAVPSLILFVFYIPVMIYYKTKLDLEGKTDKRPLKKYRYYYITGEFKQQFFYWEFVRMAEKLLIQTSIEVFQSNVIYMAETCLFVVIVYGLASFQTQPYGYKRQNFVNLMSSVSAFITLYLALVIATIQIQTGDVENPMIIIFQVMMAVTNVVFILWIVSKLIIVLLPVVFVNIEEIQKSIAEIQFLRTYMLTSKLRSRVLFQRIVNKIIVINIIRKKTSRKIVREEIVRKLRELAPEERLSSRRRQNTAAQDALEYLLRLDNPEMLNNQDLTDWVGREERELSKLDRRDKQQDDEDENNMDLTFIELAEYKHL